jgi:pyrimidine-specific ribonucleoside hydrolase
MGGAVEGGNATAVAEFNIWHDPEAAAVVLDAPTEVVMYSLDVFNRIDVDRAEYRDFAECGDPVRELAARLLRYCESTVADGAPRAAIGDAGAACFAVAPHLATVEAHPVTVALAPGAARGQTIVDRRSTWGEGEQHGNCVIPRSVSVVRDIDPAAVVDLFLTALRQGDFECL